MALNRSRLDRFIGQKCKVSRRDVRLMLAQKRILVDGIVASNIEQIIDKFSVISLDGNVLQQYQACYIMLNKPIGVVSATVDEQHTTVLDLLNEEINAQPIDKSNLHIVGRLDLNSSGLILLTNDSRWSSHLTSPNNKIIKKYLVTLKEPLTPAYINAFEQGMYFDYEGITTMPAKLEIVAERMAYVSLMEGRYHQIKRMFGRFQNQVLKLHRISIGQLALDPKLKPSDSRLLIPEEVKLIKSTSEPQP